jgi:tetratricopeptide (TPR) repeat protein
MGLVATATQKESETKTIIVNTLPRQNKAGDRKAAKQGENSYKDSPVQLKRGEAAENLSPVPSSHSLRNKSLILVALLTAMGIWVNTQKEAHQVLVDPEIRTSDKIKQEGINQNEVPEVLVDQEARESDTQTSHKKTGKKFLLSGDYIAAVKELKIAVEFNPNDSDAWGNLGLAYAYLENRQEAINAYTAGLQSLTSRGLSESPNLLEMRGHSLLEIGEFTSAISDYTKAIQSKLKREGNDAANSFAYRADAYTKAGDKGAASRDKATAECLYRLAEITNYKNDYQRNLGCIK